MFIEEYANNKIFKMNTSVIRKNKKSSDFFNYKMRRHYLKRENSIKHMFIYCYNLNFIPPFTTNPSRGA